MNLNFGEILTRAWQITWKYKVLWIFGILAGCASGSGGGNGGSSGNTNYSSGPSEGWDLPPEIQQFAGLLERFRAWVEDNMWIFILIGLAVLVLVVISIFLGTIGRIGLIKGSYQAETGAERLAFGELFSASIPYFWRVFGLSFLLGLAFLVILIPFIVFGVATAGVGLMCLLPLICLMLPVGFVAGLIIEQANRAMVLEDMGIVDGVKRGWEIARANIWPLVVMGLILFGIGAVLGLIIALPVFIVVFPTIFAFAMGQGQSFTPLYIALACICLYAPVSWVLNGILTTYTQSAWTLTYMRLAQKPVTPEAPVFAEPNA